MHPETLRHAHPFPPTAAVEQEAFEALLRASLCANCRHQDGCAFLAQTRVPIVVCELHACGAPETPRLRLLRTAPAPAAAGGEGEAEAAGLCANCDHRSDCRLPKPAGGVWSCEEYR